MVTDTQGLLFKLPLLVFVVSLVVTKHILVVKREWRLNLSVVAGTATYLILSSFL